MLHKPAASLAQRQSRALSCFAAQGARALRLRLRVGLPSLVAEPFCVSLFCRRDGAAVPALCRRAVCAVSPWRRGARPPRSDFRLARRRAPRPLFLSFPQNREPAPHMSFPRKRESRGSVLTPFILPAKSMNPAPLVIPAKAGIRALRFAFFCLSRQSGIPPCMNCPCRDFSVAPFGRFIEMIPSFNVCSSRMQIGNLKSIIRCSVFKRDLSRAIKTNL